MLKTEKIIPTTKKKDRVAIDMFLFFVLKYGYQQTTFTFYQALIPDKKYRQKNLYLKSHRAELTIYQIITWRVHKLFPIATQKTTFTIWSDNSGVSVKNTDTIKKRQLRSRQRTSKSS